MDQIKDVYEGNGRAREGNVARAFQQATPTEGVLTCGRCGGTHFVALPFQQYLPRTGYGSAEYRSNGGEVRGYICLCGAAYGPSATSESGRATALINRFQVSLDAADAYFKANNTTEALTSVATLADVGAVNLQLEDLKAQVDALEGTLKAISKAKAVGSKVKEAQETQL